MGRRVFVYGITIMNDTYQNQVWHDAKALYSVRYLDHVRNNRRDTWYKMKRFGEIWFPESAIEYFNGKQTAEIRYTSVSLGGQINPQVFSTSNLNALHWFKK